MSWSITATEIDAADVRVELEAAADAYEAQFTEPLADEVSEQIDAAIECAETLQSCVGTGKLSITLTGHANPHHQSCGGYANDSVSIYVTNMDAKPEAASTDEGTGAANDAAGPSSEAAPVDPSGAAQSSNDAAGSSTETSPSGAAGGER